MSSELTSGQVVAGRFRIESVIGEGGMGMVYLARHLTLRRQVAIKVLKGDYDSDEAFVERFRREAVAASQVAHPNVVAIMDFGQLEDGALYIVMEYLEGVGLDQVLDASGAQPLSRVLSIMIQLADAMDTSAAAGVVHRDLKPENVMLCDVRGRRDVVKLVDFGIAKLLSPEHRGKRSTLSGQIFGTPEYISPEGAMDLEVDGRSDIYSLGVLAFELATGDVPFVGEGSEVLRMQVQKPPPTPSSRMPRRLIPPAFDGIVLRCLAKRPEERYQTAAAFCRDLLKLRGQLAGMAVNLLGPAGEKGAQPRRVRTSGAWGTISPDREPVFTIAGELFSEEPRLEPQGVGGDAQGDQALSLAVCARELREQLHGARKEIAFSA
ncbi:MAG: serine/threonine-protein kinase, partial [Polyangia bacterium]|nr:serine/threonine-protein kinase [Polyangia bacterium]